MNEAFLSNGTYPNIVISSSYFRITISLSDNVEQDQTARSVQSDLDLHCPQEALSRSCMTAISENIVLKAGEKNQD